MVNDRRMQPSRRLHDDGGLWYQDYGVVLRVKASAVLHALKDPLASVTFVYHVAGAHRLATGVGLRILEDASFRDHLFQTSGKPILPGWNALVFKVEAHSPYEPGETAPSEITNVELLEAFKR
jgi:hypothetical protein